VTEAFLKPAFLAAGLLACAAFTVSGQEAVPAPEPEFEAASLKPAAPSDFDRMPMPMPIRMRCGIRDPVRFVCTRMSLRDLTVEAYEIMDYQLTGPGWMSDAKFDVAAKVPAGTTLEQADRMLRHLLTDRFKMTIHRERKEMAVYALRVGPHGHKLKEAADPAGSNTEAAKEPNEKAMESMKQLTESLKAAGGGSGARVSYRHEGISSLVRKLSDELGHPVVDETGLKGKYDFDMEFAPNQALPAVAPDGGPCPTGIDSGREGLGSPFPSISQAVQSQLGLKLDATKTVVEMIVVDKAEKTPTEN
jgi:uncharacterized protein (TIGR03435 family)